VGRGRRIARDGLTETERYPSLEDMSKQPLFDEILRLPADQRLKLLEDIWDSLAESPEDFPVPDWHRDLLDERLADPQEQHIRTWEEVQANARRSRE
jgi:putative addiction module component (TIGR02574 family)